MPLPLLSGGEQLRMPRQQAVMEVKHGKGYGVPGEDVAKLQGCLAGAQQANPAHKSGLTLAVAGSIRRVRVREKMSLMCTPSHPSQHDD
jgi:hypothetical protein